jgi:hypothetical protein
MVLCFGYDTRDYYLSDGAVFWLYDKTNPIKDEQVGS